MSPFRKFFLSSLLFFSAFMYVYFVFSVRREDFSQLFFDVSALFVLLMIIWQYFRSDWQLSGNLRPVQWSGLAIRLIFLVQLPGLSDDYFRFLWDGHLITEGHNPYLYLPSELLPSQDDFMSRLYEGMNSKEYYSVYLPLNQYFFGFSAWLGGNSLIGGVVFLRLVLIMAEAVTIFMLPRLLERLKVDASLSVLYILNPLVILESCGNLHFEVLGIMLLILCLYYLTEKRLLISAIFFGLTVSLKLIPLILAPFFLRFLGKKDAILFFIIALTTFLLLFLPYLDLQIFRNIFESIELYFQSFEFNASVYYLLREAGFVIKGYNTIAMLGKVLPVIVLVLTFVLFFHVRKGDLNSVLDSSFLAMFSYYLLSTTVHPWYVINVLFLGTLSGYKYTALSWSFLVFLSYKAYGVEGVQEDLRLVMLEYSLILLIFLGEFINIHRRKQALTHSF